MEAFKWHLIDHIGDRNAILAPLALHFILKQGCFYCWWFILIALDFRTSRSAIVRGTNSFFLSFFGMWHSHFIFVAGLKKRWTKSNQNEFFIEKLFNKAETWWETRERANLLVMLCLVFVLKQKASSNMEQLQGILIDLFYAILSSTLSSHFQFDSSLWSCFKWSCFVYRLSPWNCQFITTFIYIQWVSGNFVEINLDYKLG